MRQTLSPVHRSLPLPEAYADYVAQLALSGTVPSSEIAAWNERLKTLFTVPLVLDV